MNGFLGKNLHVDEMRNIVRPIQHWSVDERLCILYEDLLNAYQMIRISFVLTLYVSGI